MSQRRKIFSKKEIKHAQSPRRTEEIVQDLRKMIKDPRMRREAVSIVRTLNGKKIRNTSET